MVTDGLVDVTIVQRGGAGLAGPASVCLGWMQKIGCRSLALNRCGWNYRRAIGLSAVLAMGFTPVLTAQSCMTQGKMPASVYSSLSDTALALAAAVKGNDTTKVQAGSISDIASSFAPTAALVGVTASHIAGDTLQVRQIYQLDAHDRSATDSSPAEFSCALVGSTAETDFSITGLPPGVYGFVMVEATGSDPWLLAFLLQQQDAGWKMAGFYPRARTAGGHDGVWYWTTARADLKNQQPWLAWVLYGEADQLLRPANFVTSTNLDKLRSEQRSAAPPELADGISSSSPLVLKAADGSELRLTQIEAAGAPSGGLSLVLYLQTAGALDAAAAKARATAAAQALLAAHKDLRQGFQDVVVIVGSGPAAQQIDLKITDIP